MSESFYGGQPGTSFIIVASFDSVNEMIENFQKGPSYEAVHFDEHVLIDSPNKMSADNGKIYRRGYDYTNDMGGAVYIGCIAGPSGESPVFEMTTVADVINHYEKNLSYGPLLSEGEYAPLEDLIPGKTDTNEYNDSIKWACCTVCNDDSTYTTCYLGFRYPYLVVDYEANSVDPYYNRDSNEINFTNTDLVERVDNQSHPFWAKWHINIPKGIKGDTLENFRVITANSNDEVQSYDGQEDDRANGRQILVYDYYHFDKIEDGEPVTIYLGDYNMITGISISNDGTVTIEYSHDNSTQYANLIKWINNTSINTGDTEGTGNQKVHVKYNTGEEEDIGEPLNYIMRMEMVNSNYHLLVWYSDPAKRQEIINEGKSYVFDGENGWLDLGSVKDESGILIGTNYKYDLPLEITQDVLDEIAGLLNSAYPNGLEGTNLQGKVITVGNDEIDNKLIYAYDYDLNNWYYIGSLGETVKDTIKPEQVVLFDTEVMTKTDTLRAGGAFFVLEDYSIYG